MTEHKDARQLLADITAGLEGVTPGPWKFDGTSITDWGREWEASMSMEFIPNGTNEDGINERYEKDGTHIARCDPDTMQAIDREFAALTLELASAKQRIAELEAERQWQPIETAPKDETKVLVGCFKPVSQFKRRYGHIEVDSWDEQYAGFGRFNARYWPATHWMPLPASPHEGIQS